MTEIFVTQHLIELRQRMIRCFIALFVIFSGLFFIANPLFEILALPLVKYLPENQGLIATGIAAPLITPLKLTLLLSFIVALPYFLYQLWSFIGPGLYQKEKSIVWILLFPSIFLFYLGMAFAYFIVFPLVFNFFAKMVPAGVLFMPDMSQYLEFTLKLFMAFGFAFEVPIITVVLVWTGLATLSGLKQKRPYIIVGAFIIGMLLTPPDVISQILLAIPICLLFECGLILAKFVKNSD